MRRRHECAVSPRPARSVVEGALTSLITTRAIAGADADHFAQVPHGRPPKLEVTLGGAQASFIELPIRGSL